MDREENDKKSVSNCVEGYLFWNARNVEEKKAGREKNPDSWGDGRKRGEKETRERGSCRKKTQLIFWSSYIRRGKPSEGGEVGQGTGGKGTMCLNETRRRKD